MRGFFWTYTIVDEYTWHAFAFYTFYWGSVPFQFSSFMIVPLYYANILYPRLIDMVYSYLLHHGFVESGMCIAIVLLRCIPLSQLCRQPL